MCSHELPPPPPLVSPPCARVRPPTPQTASQGGARAPVTACAEAIRVRPRRVRAGDRAQATADTEAGRASTRCVPSWWGRFLESVSAGADLPICSYCWWWRVHRHRRVHSKTFFRFADSDLLLDLDGDFFFSALDFPPSPTTPQSDYAKKAIPVELALLDPRRAKRFIFLS